ncbi:MAG: hypothetical protein ACOC23_01160 [Thermodesulfobacteriota bacterium]
MNISQQAKSFFLLIGIGSLFLSCAGAGFQEGPAGDGAPSEAALFFHRLDAAVNAAGVRNASAVRIPGFPYLRADRFLEAMKDRVDTPGEHADWIDRMRARDRAARRKEISNLPDPDAILSSTAIKPVSKSSRENLYAMAADYGDALRAKDRETKDFYERVKTAVEVPSEYEPWLQFAGAYPLAVIPVAVATWNVQRKFTRFHKTAPEALPVQGKLIRFAPELSEPPATPSEIQEYVARARQDALGIPILSRAQIEAMIFTFAPVFVQDVAADYDRIGGLFWNEDQVGIDLNHPTVYYYLSHGFYKGRPALQIVYVIWYPGRRGPHAPWYEHGHLDGLTMRVSLDPSGRPFMVDFMNNCGCYHFFVPDRERVERVITVSGGADPFVPVWLPDHFPEKRLHPRIMSGWHQVENLSAAHAPVDAVPYRLKPYETLERLPRPGGRTESIFDSRGIAKGSERIEPIIFFPMGVPEVGAMRQRGHHAIKFLGRAHFDAPDLFDRNFEFRP